MSLSLLTLASPVLHAAAAVSGAVLRGAGKTFQELLQAGGDAPSKSSKASGGALDGLQAQADAVRSQLETRTLALLTEKGISIDGPLTLESDALGQLRVCGDHSQAAAIERALAGDTQLADLVEELQAVHRELTREREAQTTDRLFALDPDAARKQLEQSSPLDEPPLRIELRAARPA